MNLSSRLWKTSTTPPRVQLRSNLIFKKKILFFNFLNYIIIILVYFYIYSNNYNQGKNMITKRVNTLSESITIAITTLAQELKAEGKNILSFSAGEPDFDTPQVIKDAAIQAINEGFTKYTAVDGIPELKKAIANKLQRDNNLVYAPNQIIANNGAKHSLFNLFSATDLLKPLIVIVRWNISSLIAAVDVNVPS